MLPPLFLNIVVDSTITYSVCIYVHVYTIADLRVCVLVFITIWGCHYVYTFVLWGPLRVCVCVCVLVFIIIWGHHFVNSHVKGTSEGVYVCVFCISFVLSAVHLRLLHTPTCLPGVNLLLNSCK